MTITGVPQASGARKAQPRDKAASPELRLQLALRTLPLHPWSGYSSTTVLLEHASLLQQEASRLSLSEFLAAVPLVLAELVEFPFVTSNRFGFVKPCFRSICDDHEPATACCRGSPCIDV